MPIRKRGTSWQADVVAPSGQRIRKSFPTKAAATEYLKASTVKKSQSGADKPSRKLCTGLQPTPAPITTPQPPAHSLQRRAPKTPGASRRSTSQPPASNGRTSDQEQRSGTQRTHATASPSSAHPLLRGTVSRTSSHQRPDKSPSPTMPLSAPYSKPMPGRRFASSAAAIVHSEAALSSASRSRTLSNQALSPRKQKTGGGSQCQ